MTDNAIVERQETGLARIKSVMLSPETKERFAEMMGDNAIYYLNQVMILVANNPKLQECTVTSIMVSAMRAASLKLSVDPMQGQAWIIPYFDRKANAQIATFQLGYKGVYELAMRTNLYRFINVPQVYEGEVVTEDRMTGIHSITGRRTSNKIIGWMLYFEMFSGFKKTFYMTVEEIADHAARYSPTYKYDSSKWQDERERPKMERKTVLVNGLKRWGRFNPGDQEVLDQIGDEQGWIDRDFVEGEATELPAPTHTEAELMEKLTGEKQPEQPKDEAPKQEPVQETVEPPADWPIEVLNHFVTKYQLKAVNQARNMLNLSDLAKGADLETLEAWVEIYKGFRAVKDENGKTIYTTIEAADAANAELAAQ